VQLRPGQDVAIIACGALVEMAVRASDALQREGIGARVLNMHTIKPLDRDAVLMAATETRGIVTAEEHHLAGGLGGAVAEILAVERPTRMRMVGMPDTFAMVGPTVPLRAKYGMSAEAIADACRALLGAG
jgi:transketolase